MSYHFPTKLRFKCKCSLEEDMSLKAVPAKIERDSVLVGALSCLKRIYR